MEAVFVFGIFTIIGSIANIVNCLWEHDTHALAPWVIAFLGWVVAVVQAWIRIAKGDNK